MPVLLNILDSLLLMFRVDLAGFEGGKITSNRRLERQEACQRLLMFFTEDVIADMAGFIPLSVIGERILSEFSNEQFGHFKSSLVGLLGAYNYELSILQVKSSFHREPGCAPVGANITVLLPSAREKSRTVLLYCQ